MKEQNLINELRIGNWVEKSLLDKSISMGYQIKAFDFKEWENYIYKPIPLTEEWLKKFGFEKEKCDNKIWYELKPKNAPLFCQGYSKKLCEVFVEHLDVRVKYVHQLQNIYFVLTGKEL